MREAIKAARNAGLEHFRVDIDKRGTISVVPIEAGRGGAKIREHQTNGTTFCTTSKAAARLQAVRGPYRRGADLLPPHPAADAAAGPAVRSAEFMAAYEACAGRDRPMIGASRTKQGSLNAALVRYYLSDDYGAMPKDVRQQNRGSA